MKHCFFCGIFSFSIVCLLLLPSLCPLSKLSSFLGSYLSKRFLAIWTWRRTPTLRGTPTFAPFRSRLFCSLGEFFTHTFDSITLSSRHTFTKLLHTQNSLSLSLPHHHFHFIITKFFTWKNSQSALFYSFVAAASTHSNTRVCPLSLFWGAFWLVFFFILIFLYLLPSLCAILFYLIAKIIYQETKKLVL